MGQSARHLRRVAASQLAPRGLARRAARGWEIAAEAEIGGIQARSLMISTAPAGAEQWSPKQTKRYTHTQALLRAWDAFSSRRSTSRAAVAAFASRRAADHLPPALLAGCASSLTVGDWARQHGLHCTRTSLFRYRARHGADGNRDSRGRPRGSGTAEIPDNAWELYRSLRLSANSLPATKCYGFVAGEAQRLGWRIPGPAAFERRWRVEVPKPVEVLRRQGEHRFEADCVPKMVRDIESTAAGEVWCLDGRELDLMVRVPDARCEWREARPVVTGVLDVRSRCLRLDIRATECSDGILAGLKQAMSDWGAPREVIMDNGEAYKAAAGHPRGTPSQRAMFDDPRLGGLFTTLGIPTHNSIEYHAWAKPIESVWKKLKEEFDRWAGIAWWGGSPAERPADRAKDIKRRIDELPTEAELRELLAIWIDTYEQTPQGGAGTRGLCPRLVMEQYREEVRVVDPATIDLLCRRVVMERGEPKLFKIGRDGVRWNGLNFGRWDEDIWRLQGRHVQLRIDPDRADAVTLCDAVSGEPLCVARNSQLAGCTQEDRREMHRKQARFRRMIREAAKGRDYLLETPTRRIVEIRNEHAAAAAAAQRAALPDAPDPVVTLVRPDLAAAAGRLKKQARQWSPERRSETARTVDELLATPALSPEDTEPRRPTQDELMRSLSYVG